MNALLVGLGCFALHAVVTVVWLRLPGRTSLVGRHAISALTTHILGITLAALLLHEPFAYWPAAAVSGFGAVCWLFAFCAVYKSVSLRILTELARRPENSLPFETITREYVGPEFDARVSLLVETGCAEETEAGYAATRTGATATRRLESVQRVWGIGQSGLYDEPANDAV